MAEEGRITTFLNKKSWLIPFLFILMIVMLLVAIAGYETRRYAVELGNVAPLNTDFSFSIGGEICAMFVAIMMTMSILPSYKRHSGYIRSFVNLLTIGCAVMLFDILQMLSDGSTRFIVLNRILCIFVFSTEVSFLYFFYLYATYALRSSGKVTKITNYVLNVAFLVFALLPFINFFYPLYFTIDAEGVYHRVTETWWLCRVFLVLVAVGVGTAIVLSKEKRHTKIIISLFMAFPVFSIAAGGFKYGVSILYTSMMVSLVLIYSFIFSEHEKNLYSTNRELGLATNIQKTMLPSIFPAFPERKEFDVYAIMEPAKEVGGDFYDFFLIDDDHLGLVVADVSDKGVPAALFMMASKIMVQNYAMLSTSPRDVLEKVNKQICSNNQQEMFVTIWFGILDLRTGILRASNAGHEKPIIKRPDGHFEMIKDVHGFVVGWDSNAVFKEYEIKLEKGSKLFVYTDGVPEASSLEGKFGRERTVNTLIKYENESPYVMLNHMMNELTEFSRGVDQFDDITMLCVEYRGYDEDLKSLANVYDAKVENMDQMISPVLDALREIEVDKKLVYKIHLALEEVLTNVCRYAYAPNVGKVTIKADIYSTPKGIMLRVIDEGKPFDPLKASEPDLDAPVEERQIGGLGIFITKNIMDEISYKREDNKNILIMKKTF